MPMRLIQLLSFCLLFVVFNVGEYRRATTKDYKDHAFFDPSNEAAMAIRR